jgi:hypothetical protein
MLLVFLEEYKLQIRQNHFKPPKDTLILQNNFINLNTNLRREN